MKKALFILNLILLFGCIGNPDNIELTRKNALNAAVNYMDDRMPYAVKSIDEDGLIKYTFEKKSYILSVSNIKTGLLNNDRAPDAIISMDVFSSQYQITSEHLVFLNSGDSLIFSCSLESDMKILFIKDNIITADVPMHSRNSPLFNCASCREVQNFHMVNGELKKAD